VSILILSLVLAGPTMITPSVEWWGVEITLETKQFFGAARKIKKTVLTI
jgi:hypothetical protein